MLEVVKFIFANADKLTVITLETLIIVGLIYLLIYIFKYIMKMVNEEKTYLIGQVTERNNTIKEMTKVLLESQEVLNRLTNAVDNNKREVIAAMGKRIDSLSIEIKDILIKSRD